MKRGSATSREVGGSWGAVSPTSGRGQPLLILMQIIYRSSIPLQSGGSQGKGWEHTTSKAREIEDASSIG